MIYVIGAAAQIQENTTNAAKDLVAQFANMEFSSALMYALLLVAACFICFEGYRIYRVALMAIGFCVGYSRAHLLLDGWQLTDEQMLMAQAIAGILLGLLAGVIVHAGIFIAAYHFAQVNCSAMLTAMLLERVDVPKLLEPIASRLAGVLIAALIAWLAVKAERLVVVLLTAVIGGFAIVNIFLNMVPVFPVDVSFFLSIPTVFYSIAKVGISIAGVGVQGAFKK